jgi:hypothetical protein
VAEEEPRPTEESFHLQVEEAGVRVDGAVDTVRLHQGLEGFAGEHAHRAASTGGVTFAVAETAVDRIQVEEGTAGALNPLAT